MAAEKRTINIKYILFYWLPAAAYMAFIYYLSSVSYDDLPVPDVWNIDKVIHLLEYAFLAVLWARAINATKKDYRGFTIAAFLITFVYGISDEIHQFFVPGRFFDPFDIAADGLGALAGILVYRLIQRRMT
ncbi:MAG: VanZ family protein [Deltaproteobacteria bacterium]|nr:VanZ family protein [Deltaproteobacteria bacterium]